MVVAKKSLGQNFLHDESVLKKIVEAGEITPEDTILEVGPGKGILTKELLNRAGKVIAIELDDRLIPILKLEFLDRKNFTLIHDSALKFPAPKGRYKIIANIPYYITSPLLNHYLRDQFESGNPPEMIIFMMQKEVADKIIAKKEKDSVLSMEVKIFGDPELVTYVPRSAFSPAPNVDSAVLKIKVAKEPKIRGELKKIFWLLHVSFAQKRKKLVNNLEGPLKISKEEIRKILTACKINPDVRAEDLTLEKWQDLFDTLNL
ncbi:ribosomal RNA small subunit methyltransferase A [Candidatus Peregrinibacteria bacterium]|nr:ribosomal RNA small subunit methyltransferase A [Candidatus Peregrinibacteria bacterium]